MTQQDYDPVPLPRTTTSGIPDHLRTERLRTLNWCMGDVHYDNAATDLRCRLLKPFIDGTFDEAHPDYPPTVPDQLVTALCIQDVLVGSALFDEILGYACLRRIHFEMAVLELVGKGLGVVKRLIAGIAALAIELTGCTGTAPASTPLLAR